MRHKVIETLLGILWTATLVVAIQFAVGLALALR